MPDPSQRRRSLRLPEYDYRYPGACFVTIVTQGRLPLFGEIVDGEIKLFPQGQMIERWWQELAHKFPQVEIDEYVVMPNHFHGILFITDPPTNTTVGADLCVGPGLEDIVPNQKGGHAGPPLQKRGASLGEIIQWFKTMTTNAYIRGVKDSHWPPFPQKLWQRNYYEHIIRDQTELTQTRAYILATPLHGSLDPERFLH